MLAKDGYKCLGESIIRHINIMHEILLIIQYRWCTRHIFRSNIIILYWTYMEGTNKTQCGWSIWELCYQMHIGVHFSAHIHNDSSNRFTAIHQLHLLHHSSLGDKWRWTWDLCQYYHTARWWVNSCCYIHTECLIFVLLMYCMVVHWSCAFSSS